MGEIDDNLFDSNYKKIKNLVENLQFSAVGKTIKFGNYYFSNNYLLCAVATDLECFKQDSEMLIKRIDTNVVTPHKYQIVYGTATPHITIGYFNESQYDKAFVDSLPKLTEATIVGVDCSPAGAHGVVKYNN